MVSVNAALAVMAVFLGWTPGALVHEHVKDESVLVQVQILQVVVQEGAVEQHVRHEVVLYAFVLKVAVDLLYVLQVLQTETCQLVWLLAHVEHHHEGSIESVVAE